METMATRVRGDGEAGGDWVINGEKTWNTGVHAASHDLIFARSGGRAGDADGITAFLIPVDSPGFTVEEYLWTFNMPTDHARISLHDVRVPCGAVFGGEGRALRVVRHFSNENRIRQAASSLGAAQYCINESVAHAKERKPFGKPLAANQAIQFPLVELQTQCEMLRALIHKTAWLMDTHGAFSASDKVSMCNYWANRLCCEAADRAMQVHGGLGYSRHKPFEHIYRHHRRYRITEGAEEIQMRRVAGYMFGLHAPACAQGRDRGLMDERDLAAALRGVLGPVTIESLTRLSGGASRGDVVLRRGNHRRVARGTGAAPRPARPPGEPGAMSRKRGSSAVPGRPRSPCPRCCSAPTTPACGVRPGSSCAASRGSGWPGASCATPPTARRGRCWCARSASSPPGCMRLTSPRICPHRTRWPTCARSSRLLTK